MGSYVLSIDLGSTQFKAALFMADADGAPVAHGLARQDLEYLHGPAGTVELDARVVVEALRGVIARALREADVSAAQVGAIALTSQAQTFTIGDLQGSPRCPFISWQDVRAEALCRTLNEQATFADIHEHASFCALIPNLQICQVLHLRQQSPGLLGPHERVLPLPSFLVHELTGEAWLDDNLAAMSGFYSLQRGTWWPHALECAGLAEHQLPHLCAIGSAPVRTDAGAVRYGLPAGIPVVLAGNDQTAGAFGAQVHRSGALLLTLGTALVAYQCVDAPPTPRPALIRGPYPGGRHYAMEADGGGGSLIGWACTILTECPDYDAFFAAAASAPAGSLGLVFRPELAEARGRWEKMGLAHGPAHFARSVLESLVARQARMVRDLEGGGAPRPVLVAGGGSSRPLWLELLSAALERPLQRASADPLLGAARLALAALDAPLVPAARAH